MRNFNIIFKKLAESDLTLLQEWFQIPHVIKWFALNKKYWLEMIKVKYLPRINNESIPSFIIYDTDKAIGYIQYYLLTDHR